MSDRKCCDSATGCIWCRSDTTRPTYSAPLDAFIADMRKRMAQGEAEYGHANTLHASPADLARELREELVDVANYAFMLSLRVDAIVKRMLEEEE